MHLLYATDLNTLEVPRGRAFIMTGATSRTNVDVLVNDRVRNLFEKLRDDAK